MLVKFDFASTRQTRWHEYATRFVFGGLVTLLAGLIADRFGPAWGGLFLAFPAISPATASLIEKHEREKKESAGLKGKKRGRLAAGIDAAGAAMGSLGLAAFALTAHLTITHWPLWPTLMTATVAWIAVAVAAWFLRRHIRFNRKAS
jgi:hypothetical protein